MITAAYDANNLIMIGARVPQIYKNFAARSTGQLSIITFAANTLGCIARLFTTLQEGGGSAMMRSYALSEYCMTDHTSQPRKALPGWASRGWWGGGCLGPALKLVVLSIGARAARGFCAEHCWRSGL